MELTWPSSFGSDDEGCSGDDCGSSCTSEERQEEDGSSEGSGSEGHRVYCFTVSALVVLLLAIITSLLCALFVAELPPGCRFNQPSTTPLLIGAGQNWIGALVCLGVFSLISFLQQGLQERSRLVRDVQWFLLVNWFQQFVTTIYCVAFATAIACPIGQHSYYKQSTAALIVRYACSMYSNYLYMSVLRKRIELTEKAFHEARGSRQICILQHVGIVPPICFTTVACYKRVVEKDWDIQVGMLVQSSSSLYFSIWYLGLAFCAWRSFTEMLLVTRLGSESLGNFAQVEAAWARQALARLRVSMVLPLVVAAVCEVNEAAMVVIFEGRYSDIMGSISQVASFATEVACLLRVLGMFQEHRPSLPSEMALAIQPSMRPLPETPPPLGITASSGPSGATSEAAEVAAIAVATDEVSGVWTRKVSELAGRRIEVAALLAFHERLGSRDVMPHYSPWRSTTNDVVRQAVIPLTRTASGGGEAYTTLFGGGPAHAECMVTHTWSNLFVDLVAAVVADAVGSEDFSHIADLLAARSHERLESELRAKGAIHESYWICAFCINQHASICAGFGQQPVEGSLAYSRWDATRRDSVTGEVFSCCDCAEQKHFNDSPHECELNKFDSMMEFIHSRVPGFRQLIAIDREFRVFSRIWCVAELVQAHTSGIAQGVQLSSSKDLREDADDVGVYVRLATLTVADAEASRPEDKEQILSKIPCILEFDAQLQAIVFGDHGLMRRCFVGYGVFEAAAHIARRMKALANTQELSRRDVNGSSLLETRSVL